MNGVIPDKLHDGDLMKFDDKVFVEYIDTNGRIGLRVTNSVGSGVLLHDRSLELMHDLMQKIAEAS